MLELARLVRAVGVRGFTRGVHLKSHVVAKIFDTDAADLRRTAPTKRAKKENL